MCNLFLEPLSKPLPETERGFEFCSPSLAGKGLGVRFKESCTRRNSYDSQSHCIPSRLTWANISVLASPFGQRSRWLLLMPSSACGLSITRFFINKTTTHLNIRLMDRPQGKGSKIQGLLRARKLTAGFSRLLATNRRLGQ